MSDRDTPPDPEESPAADGDDHSRIRAAMARQRTWATGLADRAAEWTETRRVTTIPVDVAVRLYERDRSVFGSVLGAAIALRLFLFAVPAMVAAVGLINMVFSQDAIHGLISTSGVTGSVATQIEAASRTSSKRGFGLFLTGLALTLWAGRSLTNVLAACSAASWGLNGRAAKATLKMAGGVTGLVVVILMVSSVLNRLRAEFGPAVAATSLTVVALVFGVGWFAVSWVLPRRTSDPGALLPGAALVGLTMMGLQWFMQFYLPEKIASSSDVMGSMGLAVAVLGYLFIIGRIMAGSLVLNSVMYERVGSLSQFVFGLPVLRAVPRRYERFATFFDLDHRGADERAPVDDGPAGDPG